ncbi:hypothetical protein GCM10010280_65320 [Streptomyces pilosus]|uniref:Uncharacterized protein n=1 Tax=Streptomyces pilosus TaxID=28893 RepID=A0A918C6M1_9ACTN|nr:hypothetical protein GCM10010280_65320 [Streptomyces pilosus]
MTEASGGGAALRLAASISWWARLDHTREARLVTEAAVDRVRDTFGRGIIGPAAVIRRAC